MGQAPHTSYPIHNATPCGVRVAHKCNITTKILLLRSKEHRSLKSTRTLRLCPFARNISFYATDNTLPKTQSIASLPNTSLRIENWELTSPHTSYHKPHTPDLTPHTQCHPLRDYRCLSISNNGEIKVRSLSGAEVWSNQHERVSKIVEWIFHYIQDDTPH